MRISDWSSDVCSSDLRWRCPGIEEAVDLPRLVPAPGRIAGLRDPDLRRMAMFFQKIADSADEFGPALPFRVPGSWEVVDADGIDIGEPAPAAHQRKPVTRKYVV